MTSFEVNLLERESKSSRSNVVSHRVRRYLSATTISVKSVSPQQPGGPTVTRYMVFDFCEGMANIHVRS